MSKIINFFKALHRANKAEINEIKSLKVTDEDMEQGARAATLAATALASCGIPLGAAAIPVLKIVFAYCIRDAKDGIESPDKLLIKRIKEELAKANL